MKEKMTEEILELANDLLEVIDTYCQETDGSDFQIAEVTRVIGKLFAGRLRDVSVLEMEEISAYANEKCKDESVKKVMSLLFEEIKNYREGKE